jgi:hypothetical protein
LNTESGTLAVFLLLYTWSSTLYLRNWEEQRIQLIRKKETMQNRFWLFREFWKPTSGNYKLARVTLAVRKIADL